MLRTSYRPLGKARNLAYRRNMADEPENHTLRLLREMREENLRLHAGTRELVTGVREENLRTHAETREQLTFVLETVVGMAKTVNATAEAVTLTVAGTIALEYAQLPFSKWLIKQKFV